MLVDPKMVEMSQFKDIPHLMSPVVTEMSKAAAILEWATVKMDERYELLWRPAAATSRATTTFHGKSSRSGWAQDARRGSGRIP